MAIEIERKFLVLGEDRRSEASQTVHIRQGYLGQNGKSSVRVRIKGDNKACITIKSTEPGASRYEFEYVIPVPDAEELLNLCEGEIVDKLRHNVPHDEVTWEVDVFLGANQGLVVAEVELDHVNQKFDKPAWIGEEVTGDQRFYNAELSKRPFSAW